MYALNFRQLLDTAQIIIHETGIALSKKNAIWLNVKEDARFDIKLQADVEAEEMIINFLNERTPYGIFSEEIGWVNQQAPSEPYWVIDPLDGTVNYSLGIPLCCSSIALVQNDKPLLGIIHDFNRSETFTGIVGEGAWLNAQPICVSKSKDVSRSVLATGFPMRRDFSKSALYKFALDAAKWRKVRMLGSAALSLCYVASGRIDAYQEGSIMFWDVAAGCAIVEAAGGQVQIIGRVPEKPLNVFAHNSQLIEGY